MGRVKEVEEAPRVVRPGMAAGSSQKETQLMATSREDGM